MSSIVRLFFGLVLNELRRTERSRFRRRLRPDPLLLEGRVNPSVIVTGLSPTSGPTAGGSIVTIMGTGFTSNGAADVTAVCFGSTPVLQSDFAVVTPSPGLPYIVAESPQVSKPGPVDVTVTVGLVTSGISTADVFTYIATPTVSSVSLTGSSSAASGPPGGGTQVTITGDGFAGATAVDFGADPATSFNVLNAMSITAVSPEGTGVVNVTVTTPLGTSATTPADHFSYEPVGPGLESARRSGVRGHHGGDRRDRLGGRHNRLLW